MSANDFSYTSTTRNIEEKLRDIIETIELKNAIYISDTYKESKGLQSVRIDAVGSTSIELTLNSEHRDYDVEIHYYIRSNDPIGRSKNVKNKVDRLVQVLNNNQIVDGCWVDLRVEAVEFNVEEDSENLSATKLSVSLTNYNYWS
jgi:hypothetical protein